MNEAVIAASNQLKDAYFKKGFKDWGLEGKMRNYAHFIEDSTKIPMIEILQLRRHEKDFLLRGEERYALEFKDLVDKLLNGYLPNSYEYQYLIKYRESFLQLVDIYNELGIHNNSGQYGKLNSLLKKLDLQYTSVNIEAATQINKLRNDFVILLILVSVASLIFAIILSVVLSRKLTKGISDLDNRMNAFIKSRFNTEIEQHQYVSKITEIRRLNKDFILLKNTLRSTINDLENSYEEAKKASDSKGIFLANMSHEIRTPLNGIIGMAHILKSGKLSEEQKEHLETMEFSANHLLELINTILDHSKIAAGKMEIESVSFDLKSDLSKLVKIFDYRIIEKKLRLEFEFNGDNSRFKIGDSIKLQQVVINLLNNAVKFTKEGKVKLTVNQLFINTETQHLHFEISDTGIGISEEKIKTLFDPFEQGDTSITRNYGGTGLGLSISNQLVQLLGSTIEVKSRENEGSVFSFDLILKQGELISHQFLNHRTDYNCLIDKKVKVLLAEDNIINQKVLGMMLQQNNAEVVVANNGEEAVDLFLQHDFDMIFMDIQMPILDGLQATRNIRLSIKNKQQYIPIIAITANAFSEDREKAFEAGMDDFLSKPMKPLELKSIFEKYSNRLVY